MKGARFPVENERARPRQRGDELSAEGAELLDPCIDNPELHIVYAEEGFASRGTRQGKTTIEILSLNRWWLTMARADALAETRDDWELAKDAILKGTVAGERALARLLTPRMPYAAIRRQFVFQWLDQTTGVHSITTELGSAQTGTLGTVVGEEQQQLTREVFEQYEHAAKTYTLEDQHEGDRD